MSESLQPLDPRHNNLFDAAEIAPILLDEGLYREGKALQAVVEVAVKGTSDDEVFASEFLRKQQHKGALCLRETIDDESVERPDDLADSDEEEMYGLVRQQIVTGVIVANSAVPGCEKRLLVHDDISPATNFENGRGNHGLPKIDERNEMKAPNPDHVVGCYIDKLSPQAHEAILRAAQLTS